MTTPTRSFGTLVQIFFTTHLQNRRQVSPQTVASYRDTFRLLLEFLESQRGISPAAVTMTHLSADTILAFLDYLEQKRGNCARTRNLRLAAIHTFFRFAVFQDPTTVEASTRVLAIPIKRTVKKLVLGLQRNEIEAILNSVNRGTTTGRRDYALLLTMYNTGARVSEITTLKKEDVRFGPRPYLQLNGKGRKQRTVPIWAVTSRTLKDWFAESAGPVAFPNARGYPLTRDGVDYLLKLAVSRAESICPSLKGQKISPHTFRHTTALHLLQSGTDLSVIALWLGHESIETTHGYVEADLSMKQKTLEMLTPVKSKAGRFKPDDRLMKFLQTL
jgi:site-specific recombinase XerD